MKISECCKAAVNKAGRCVSCGYVCDTIPVESIYEGELTQEDFDQMRKQYLGTFMPASKPLEDDFEKSLKTTSKLGMFDSGEEGFDFYDDNTNKYQVP